MTFGSLFAGIGGMDLGLERAGMTCRWQVEIDPFCRKVLEKHWPEVPKYGDIRQITGDELEQVDVIAGGFPCQPVSLAGKQLAQSDERWLWPEFSRIIRMARPRFALLENVEGLLVHGAGDVLRDLAESGYDAEWDCLPAAAFGAPHLRYRVFIVAYPNGSRLEGRQCQFMPQCPSERAVRAGSTLAHSDCEPKIWTAKPRAECHNWSTEPDVGRVAYGVPSRVDRLRALGNSVVPAVAEWIGRRIVEASRCAA